MYEADCSSLSVLVECLIFDLLLCRLGRLSLDSMVLTTAGAPAAGLAGGGVMPLLLILLLLLLFLLVFWPLKGVIAAAVPLVTPCDPSG